MVGTRWRVQRPRHLLLLCSLLLCAGCTWTGPRFDLHTPTIAPTRQLHAEATATIHTPPQSEASGGAKRLMGTTPRPVVTATPAFATNDPRLPTIEPHKSLTHDEEQHLFATIWSLIDERYLYADYRGVDWDAIRQHYDPQRITYRNDADFYQHMVEMVEQLNDNHSRFAPPEMARVEDQLSNGHEEQVGIGVVTIPVADGAMIETVFPNGPSAAAGLRPRDRIVAVDGQPYYGGPALEGPAGTDVQLRIKRPNEGGFNLTLIRRKSEAQIGPELHQLPGEIAYLRVSTLWIHDTGTHVSEILTDALIDHPPRGIILDLRHNPGGWRSVLTDLLSYFVRDEVGSFFDQQQVNSLSIKPNGGPDLRGMPLVVLIDQDTASYAEVLAGILQSEAHATVVGTPSAGNTETIYAYDLEHGARLWVAQEGFRLRNGVNFEGRGVQPDIVINKDWTRFREEDDPMLQAALQLLGVQ